MRVDRLEPVERLLRAAHRRLLVVRAGEADVHAVRQAHAGEARGSTAGRARAPARTAAAPARSCRGRRASGTPTSRASRGRRRRPAPGRAAARRAVTTSPSSMFSALRDAAGDVADRAGQLAAVDVEGLRPQHPSVPPSRPARPRCAPGRPRGARGRSAHGATPARARPRAGRRPCPCRRCIVPRPITCSPGASARPSCSGRR